MFFLAKVETTQPVLILDAYTRVSNSFYIVAHIQFTLISSEPDQQNSHLIPEIF